MKNNYRQRIRSFLASVFPGSGKDGNDQIIIELKKKLQDSTRQFEILSKAINDAIWDWNINEGSIHWNHGLFAIYGYDPASQLHNFDVWASNVHPEDKEEVMKGLEEVLRKKGESWNCIYRYKCHNGNYKFTYDRGAVFWEGSKPVRMLGAMQDIDERMIALREIEKLSLVASKTDNLVMITDANEHIEWVNQGFVRRTGYSMHDFIGKKSTMLQGPDTDRAALGRIRESLNKCESITEELLNYARDGTKYWVKININPVFDAANKLVKFVSIQTDITLLKEYEKKITAIAHDLTNLIATVNAPVFGLDRNGIISECNNRASEITGLNMNESIGRSFIELVDEGYRSVMKEKLDLVYSGEPISGLELPMITKEGTPVIILLNATPRKRSNNEIESVFLVGQDITEITQYRQSLEEIVRERTHELQMALKKEKELVTIKSRFASIVSHEFRTPLSTIAVSANHIKKFRERLRPEDIDKKLSAIQDQVNQMTHLLEDVLTIGKNESGTILISKKKVNLHTLIASISHDVQNQFKHSHRVHCQLDLPEPEIFSDDGLLRNIFVNLLTNAIKFSPGKDAVLVKARMREDFIFFEVIDQGIGIPAGELDRIFTPFDRATNATAISGTGLGLPIVKKALDLLGGAISVSSTPGHDTRFSVSIPVK